MPHIENIAAIDVGSNAIRLFAAHVDNHKRISIFKKERIPLRLGTDSFKSKKIGQQTIIEAEKVFKHFKKILDYHQIKYVKAVATSALRDAQNSKEFIERVLHASEIPLQVIDGKEEARLVFTGILNLSKHIDSKNLIIIDIGGGSVEVIIASSGNIIAMESFNMGTVRYMNDSAPEKLAENFQNKLSKFFKSIKANKLENAILVGSGGNFRRMGKLRKQVLSKRNDYHIKDDEVDLLLGLLSKKTKEEKVNDYQMREDRAEVIVPAMKIAQIVLSELPQDEIYLPEEGLADGILFEMSSLIHLKEEKR